MNKTSYQEKLIEKIIKKIEMNGGKDCLSSIILTGSFGRGEPTFVTDDEGILHLKSDIEIALVFPKTSQKKRVELLIKNVSSDFTEDLNLMPINEKRVKKAYNFNFSIRSPKYKTIFTYDLFNGSKTIWGVDFIGKKTVSLADVDIYESKRLVANRIGELVYLSNTVNQNEYSYVRKQWKGKLVLAIVSAWLICEGEYVSSYHGQYEKVCEKNEKIKTLFGIEFLDEYKKVFHFLRDNGQAYEVEDELLCKYVRAIDKYFEKKQIKVPKVNSASRVLKYSIKYIESGVKYGVKGFENNILQSLISEYWTHSRNLIQTANVWHKVLY